MGLRPRLLTVHRFAVTSCSLGSVSSKRAIASRMLSSASSRVFPCDQQPFTDGQLAHSSSRFDATLAIIGHRVPGSCHIRAPRNERRPPIRLKPRRPAGQTYALSPRAASGG